MTTEHPIFCQKILTNFFTSGTVQVQNRIQTFLCSCPVYVHFWKQALTKPVEAVVINENDWDYKPEHLGNQGDKKGKVTQDLSPVDGVSFLFWFVIRKPFQTVFRTLC